MSGRSAQPVMRTRLGSAFEKAEPQLKSMGDRAANEESDWAQLADYHVGKQVPHYQLAR